MVFVHDRSTGVSRSVASDGGDANGPSGNARMTPDARFVAFQSSAGNHVSNEAGSTDVFLYDRTLDTVERVSVTSQGAQANGDSTLVSLSDDGRFVVFLSPLTDLIANDSNGEDDFFIVPNPLLESGVFRTIDVGDAVTDIQLGLVPDAGQSPGEYSKTR